MTLATSHHGTLIALGKALADRDAPGGDNLDGGDPELLERLRRALSGPRGGTAALRTRITRGLADIEYFLARPLGWREGVVVVWAGMRGAVTLAAVQTLPEDTPQRSLLVLIAFLVAAGSLMLQGGTLPRVVAAVRPAPEREAPESPARLAALLATAAAGANGDRAAALEAQRTALLDARDDGLFSAPALDAALARVDAEDIGFELRAA